MSTARLGCFNLPISAWEMGGQFQSSYLKRWTECNSSSNRMTFRLNFLHTLEIMIYYLWSQFPTNALIFKFLHTLIHFIHVQNNKNEEKYFKSALLNFKYFRCTNQFIMIVQDSKTIFVRRYTRIEKEEMRVRENLSICWTTKRILSWVLNEWQSST